MTVLSKLKIAKFVAIHMVKQNTNLKGGILAAWVVVGAVMLVRGIRRDRQSSTAATTDKLLEKVKEEARDKEGEVRSSTSFTDRLKVIFKIICPGLKTKETWFIVFLSVLLVCK